MTNHLAISRNYWFIKMFCLLYIQNKILLGDRRQHLCDEYIQDCSAQLQFIFANSFQRGFKEKKVTMHRRRRASTYSKSSHESLESKSALLVKSWMYSSHKCPYMWFWNCIRVRFSLFLESLISLLNNYRVNQNTPTFEKIVRGQIDGHICAILSA
jgi:hypothetical protein